MYHFVLQVHVWMGLSICHHFQFNYIQNLYVLSMCFVRYRNWIVCTICNAASTLFFGRKIFRRILAFPLHPRYIRCSTVITPDIVEFNWFETTCLSPKSAAVIEVISVDWARVILVPLFLVKFPIFTQTSVLSHHGQLGVVFAFLPPLFLVHHLPKK